VPVPGGSKAAQADAAAGVEDDLARTIIDCEVNSSEWTLMHRYNKASELLQGVLQARRPLRLARLKARQAARRSLARLNPLVRLMFWDSWSGMHLRDVTAVACCLRPSGDGRVSEARRAAARTRRRRWRPCSCGCATARRGS